MPIQRHKRPRSGGPRSVGWRDHPHAFAAPYSKLEGTGGGGERNLRWRAVSECNPPLDALGRRTAEHCYVGPLRETESEAANDLVEHYATCPHSP